MRPLRDDDLILHHYGEAPDPEAVREALARDPQARARYEALARLLASVPDDPPPERGEEYGGEVWARLAPRLAAPPPRKSLWERLLGWLLPGRPSASTGLPRWAVAAAAVLLLAAGFLLGRSWDRPAPAGALVLSGEARQRLLERSVAAHLSDSERLLVELANAPADARVDLAAEREWAEALLSANRLYRLAAEKAGQRRIAALLGELEPLLLDLAHAPAEGTPEDLALLQQRLSDRGTLFKVRVLEGRLAAGQPRPVQRPGSAAEEL